MAFHEVPSEASPVGVHRPYANDNPSLFGYYVPSLKPLNASRPAQRAAATCIRVIDLNDNENTTIPAGHHLAPTKSRRTDRPVVAMRQPCAESRLWPDEKRPSRPELRILWSLGLAAVLGCFLVASFQA